MPQPVHPAPLIVLRSRYAKTVTKRQRAALTKEARHTAPRAARSSGASSARDQGRQLQQMNERLREDAECEHQQHRPQRHDADGALRPTQRRAESMTAWGAEKPDGREE